MTQSTPTPWEAVECTVRHGNLDGFTNGLWHIYQVDRPARQLPLAVLDRHNDHHEPTREQAEANANLIVNAVNCHDELLAALKAAVGGVGMLARVAGVNIEDWTAWEKSARAAIAKAGGESPAAHASP
jgi:hypothetical protein